MTEGWALEEDEEQAEGDPKETTREKIKVGGARG